MDTLDESSEPATCPHTLSRLPDPAPLRVVSYLLGSSSHPGFPALRPQASGLRLAQQGSHGHSQQDLSRLLPT